VTLLADLTVRSSLMVFVGLATNLLLRHRSAALRHAVLATAMCAAAIVAPLSLVLPSWDLPAFQTEASERSSVAGGSAAATLAVADPPANLAVSDPPPQSRTVTVVQATAVVWASGVVLSAMVLLRSLYRLRRIAGRGVKGRDEAWADMITEISAAYGLRRAVIICHTDAPDLLATFGLFRPCVILPAQAREWDRDRVRVVLSHELAHIRRHDWTVQVGAELLRIVYWFNPLIWAACTGLRRESEQACDDAVLTAGVRPREYAAHLLALARTCRRPGPGWAGATPMARPSTLERRFAAMLNPTVDRRPLSFRALALTAVVLMAVTLPAAAFRARQTLPLPLTGSVYDTSGAVLPGVELTVEDAKRNKSQAVTDAKGQFEFPQLAPGHYVLQAALPGFRALRHEFELRQERDWDRAITLQVGEVQETINVSEQRTNGSAAPPPSGPQRVRVGGNIRTPRKLKDVRPIYPPSMRDAGREGVVPIEALIGRDGLVHSVRVLSANIHPAFAVAAADAVRQWTFSPTLLNGVPVEVTMTVTITFSLSD
jgi:TonB family protein